MKFLFEKGHTQIFNDKIFNIKISMTIKERETLVEIKSR